MAPLGALTQAWVSAQASLPHGWQIRGLMARLLPAVILALALAACDAGTSVEEDAECIATPESAAAIAEGLTVRGGATLRHAFAVALPPDPDFGFVVAAEIDGIGLYEDDGEIGTWAVGELGGGPIFAANRVAEDFTDWGSAATEGSPADLARDAVATSAQAYGAELCVEASGRPEGP